MVTSTGLVFLAATATMLAVVAAIYLRPMPPDGAACSIVGDHVQCTSGETHER